MGCTEDAFAVIFSGTISLQFIVREETYEPEHGTCAFPENSLVYPEMLNDLHDSTTLSLSVFDTMGHLTLPTL